jgi:hypothetical protein
MPKGRATRAVSACLMYEFSAAHAYLFASVKMNAALGVQILYHNARLF